MDRYITVLKSKIHNVIVTNTDLNYEGSCSIDGKMMDEADIRDNEQIHIYSTTTGVRFITYAIRSNIPDDICVNGAGARLVCPGDKIIICSYAIIDSRDNLTPKIITI